MVPRRPRLLAASALALLAAPFAPGLRAVARADVVTLTTGRTVSGTVETENADVVVVKTPNGKVTLPRRLVASIERQSRGETLLALARERAWADALDEAEALLRRALEDEDPDIVKRAQDELRALEARRAKVEKLRPKATTPMPVPEGARGEPTGARTLQEQLDRARWALEAGDHNVALRLLAPLVRDNPDDLGLRYLLGRAHELGRDPRAAAAEYRRVLGPTFQTDDRVAPWLGELARRARAGEEVARTSPGVAPGWQRIETERFAVYHPFPSVEPWFATEPEQALDDVLARLSLQRHQVKFHGRLQVLIFESAEAYRADSGHEHYQGHAKRLLAPDGLLVVIRAYPDQRFYASTYRHEIAHAVVALIAPRTPGWANEGVACFTEPARSRAFWRRIVRGRKATGDLPDLFAFLRGEQARGGDIEAIRTYYGLASVAFEALVEHAGSPRKALALAEKIARLGPEKALLDEGIARRDLEDTIERLSQDASAE